MRNSNHKRRFDYLHKFSSNISFVPKPRTLIPILFTVILVWLSMFQLKIILVDLGVMKEGMAWYARYPLLQVAAAAFGIILITSLMIEGLQEFFKTIVLKLTEISFLRLSWIILFISILIGLLYSFYRPFNYLSNGFFIRVLFGWTLLWLYYAIFMPDRKFLQLRQEQRIIITALMAAFTLMVGAIFCKIDNNPLSATWSEGNVLYYATSFFSKRIYGERIGLPIINPGRALLQSFPFLIPDLPIAAHRIWDSLLWIIMPLLIGYSLLKRFRITNFYQVLGFLLFSALFLNIGPVYYHLLVIPLILLIGFRPRFFWSSLVVVILASIWAGLTRINWYPFAGSLAAILYWLEISNQKRISANVWKPIIWFTIGFLISVTSHQLYVRVSGTPAEYFENPFSTPLLWERLLPNPTNPLGILPSILLATFPSLIFIGVYYFTAQSYAWIRRAGVFTLLLAFFLGGFLVSVRIGGGNNLHNFDAFILLLLILIGYILFDQIARDKPPTQFTHSRLKTILIALLLFLPIFKPFLTAPTFPAAVPEEEFKIFQAQIESDIKAGKSILMLDEAHLIAFDFWEMPPDPPEFDKVFLSEAAITGNHIYLDHYYTAISSLKYDYIVTEPLTPYYFGSEHPFDRETEAWIEAIEKPTLCYYQIIFSYQELGLDFLAPRETACDDLDLQP